MVLVVGAVAVVAILCLEILDERSVTVTGLARRVVPRILVTTAFFGIVPLLVFRGRRIHQPEIVLGVLQEVLRAHAVAARGRITRQLLILLVNLRRVSANARARAVAVVGLIAGIAGLASAAAP